MSSTPTADAIVLPVFRCAVCRHEWHPRNPERPKRCASCKSPYWDRQKKTRTKAA